MKEAQVVLARCPKEHKTYGIRMEKKSGKWHLTWAFPINNTKAESEGYQKFQLSGEFQTDNNYNGCPFCRTRQFLLCDKCGKLTCYHNESHVTCAWCGNTGNAEIRNEFTLNGGEM